MGWWEAIRLGSCYRRVAPREQSLPLDRYAEHWDLCERNDLVRVAGSPTEKILVVQPGADVDLQTVFQSDRSDERHHVLGRLSSLGTEVLVMEDRQTRGFASCFE